MTDSVAREINASHHLTANNVFPCHAALPHWACMPGALHHSIDAPGVCHAPRLQAHEAALPQHVRTPPLCMLGKLPAPASYASSVVTCLNIA